MNKIHISALCGAFFVAGLLAVPAYKAWDYKRPLPPLTKQEESCQSLRAADNYMKDLAENDPRLKAMMLEDDPTIDFSTRYIVEGICSCPNQAHPAS